MRLNGGLCRGLVAVAGALALVVWGVVWHAEKMAERKARLADLEKEACRDFESERAHLPPGACVKLPKSAEGWWVVDIPYSGSANTYWYRREGGKVELIPFNIPRRS